MNSVKVYYLNDTDSVQYLFVNNMHALHSTLQPTEGAIVEVHPANDQAVFVKSWGSQILIGITDL